MKFIWVLLLCSVTALADDASTGLADPAPALPPPDSATSGSMSTDSQPNPLADSKDPLLAPPEPTPAAPTAEASTPTPSPTVSNVETPRRDKDIYDELAEFQTTERGRIADDKRREQRNLFFHEGGKFQWGLDYVLSAFPKYDFDPGPAVQTYDTQGVALSWSFFPVTSLTFGRFGIGAQAGLYSTKYVADRKQAFGNHSFDTFGLKAMYEFQYFLGQVLVPHVFYSYERVGLRAYSISGGSRNINSERFDSPSAGGGIYLNLNRLEPTAASFGLVDLGVKKFYLAYSFSDRMDKTKSGLSHFLGLRFEY